MTVLTEHAIIREAAALIAKRGKAVGDYTDGERLCPLGAISWVIYGDAYGGRDALHYEDDPGILYLDTCFTLITWLTCAGDPIYKVTLSVSGWSDKADQGHVIAAMRAAAAGGA